MFKDPTNGGGNQSKPVVPPLGVREPIVGSLPSHYYNMRALSSTIYKLSNFLYIHIESIFHVEL